MPINLIPEEVVESQGVDSREKLKVIRRELIRTAEEYNEVYNKHLNIACQLELMDKEIKRANKDEEMLAKLVNEYDYVLFKLSKLVYS